MAEPAAYPPQSDPAAAEPVPPPEQVPPPQQPPPQPTPAEVEAARTELAQLLQVAFVAAVIWQLTNGGEGDSESVGGFVRSAIKWWIITHLVLYGVDYFRPGQPSQEQRTDEWTNLIIRWSSEHAEKMKRRPAQNSPAGVPLKPRPPVEAPGADDSWARAAAMVMANRISSESAIAAADQAIGEDGKVIPYKKVWISRADGKVRSSHQRLHGKHRELFGVFQRWPLTGQELRFPGDPHAPLADTIGCRCWLWITRDPKTDLGKLTVPLNASIGSKTFATSDQRDLVRTAGLMGMSDGELQLYEELLEDRLRSTE